jgi:tellurite resistance protein TerC
MDASLILFPFADYWWFYAGFTLFVLGMLALDLGVFHRDAHEVKFKEALGWSIAWIALALLFCYGFWQYAQWKLPTDPRLLAAGLTALQAATLANQTALEFLTGYVVEKSLSVDNVFVFVVVFSYFAVPAKYQHRVLFFGILGALVFRIIFIALGAALMQLHWVIWLFGIFLILTGVKILFAPEKPIDPEKNPIIRLLRKIIPVTPKLDGQNFFVRHAGVLHATPLFVCLVFLEVTDIVFAVDSVPAIFAITKEPLIVFTSNVFAILGLRAIPEIRSRPDPRLRRSQDGLAQRSLRRKIPGHLVPRHHRRTPDRLRRRLARPASARHRRHHPAIHWVSFSHSSITTPANVAK